MWTFFNRLGEIKQGTVAVPGTVTSVGITMPSEFVVSDSPVSASGTLAITKATQVANTVFAGPATGADAAPTFRALTATDVPSLTVSKVSDFTESVQDVVGALIAAGTNVTVSYDDGAGTLTIAATVPSHAHAPSDITSLSEAIDDRVWGLLVAGSNITLSYDDVANTLTITSSLPSHTHNSTDVSDFAEAVDDRVSSLLVAGDNVSLTYNDSANTMTVSSTTANDYRTIQSSGRLTLVSGNPIPAFDVGSTTLYYTSYKGDKLSLWDGSAWTVRTFTERSIVLPSTANTSYFVWGYWNSGTSELNLAYDAWTSMSSLSITSVALSRVVTCSSAHGLAVNDIIVIAGNSSSFAVNGVWRVYTITSPTVFTYRSLNGGGLSNSTGTGGTVRKYVVQSTPPGNAMMRDGVWVKSTDNTYRLLGVVRVGSGGSILDYVKERLIYNINNPVARPLKNLAAVGATNGTSSINPQIMNSDASNYVAFLTWPTDYRPPTEVYLATGNAQPCLMNGASINSGFSMSTISARYTNHSSEDTEYYHVVWYGVSPEKSAVYTFDNADGSHWC
jgi:hypothetical protein